MLKTTAPVDARVLTVGDLLDFLAPSFGEPKWPPDVFALAMALLQKSGAYTKVVESWPPAGTPGDWATRTKALGEEWREALMARKPIPEQIGEWWGAVVTHRDDAVAKIGEVPELWQTLMQLCAASDEAAHGAGIPSISPDDDDDFDFEAATQLLSQQTLCKEVDPSRACVLPKLHTPQNGMTVRSLSHNLALCFVGDVKADWHRLYTKRMTRKLNLLLVPWPWTIQPSQFRQVDGNLNNLPSEYGFFDFEPKSAGIENSEFEAIFEHAEEVVGKGEIDCVIFPELSVTPVGLKSLRSLVAETHRAVLIAGVADAGKNYLAMFVPLADDRVTEIRPQHKHHRWRLEKSQILQYGLGSSLDPAMSLWEKICMDERHLCFVSTRPWLTFCALICEDLARQDPVADLLRSVAPNLLITLLMDGPQLVSRWSARYATVFADDPGCSVLTLTSLGMTSLCRPRGMEVSRKIALWKDARSGGPVEIDLPKDARGVVLSLSIELHDEWAADGRSDYGTTGYPILAGIYPVRGK